MLVRLGIGYAAVEEPVIQLVEALDPCSWREEAFAHQTHLVLDLPLLPARRRSAGGRLHEIMAAHLHKAPVEPALLAKEHRLLPGCWTPRRGPSLCGSHYHPAGQH